MIKREILIATRMIWPVSSDKWKAFLVMPVVTFCLTAAMFSVLSGCQSYEESKNGVRRWEIFEAKKLGVSGLSLAQAFNQLSR